MHTSAKTKPTHACHSLFDRTILSRLVKQEVDVFQLTNAILITSDKNRRQEMSDARLMRRRESLFDSLIQNNGYLPQ